MRSLQVAVSALSILLERPERHVGRSLLDVLTGADD
jgi:hypothetical protein